MKRVSLILLILFLSQNYMLSQKLVVNYDSYLKGHRITHNRYMININTNEQELIFSKTTKYHTTTKTTIIPSNVSINNKTNSLVENKELNGFPVPFSNDFVINSEILDFNNISNIKVLNTSGKLINNYNYEINLNEIVFHFDDGNSVGVYKFLIEMNNGKTYSFSTVKK